jgi:hypothetical protein
MFDTSAPGGTTSGGLIAAVVLVAHGFAEAVVDGDTCELAFDRCADESFVVVLACDVAVSAAREPSVVPAWPVSAVPAVPSVLPPVVELVSAGSGVVLELDDGVGVGVGEAGVMVADGEPEDVGVVEPLGEELGGV